MHCISLIKQLLSTYNYLINTLCESVHISHLVRFLHDFSSFSACISHTEMVVALIGGTCYSTLLGTVSTSTRHLQRLSCYMLTLQFYLQHIVTPCLPQLLTIIIIIIIIIMFRHYLSKNDISIKSV